MTINFNIMKKLIKIMAALLINFLLLTPVLALEVSQILHTPSLDTSLTAKIIFDQCVSGNCVNGRGKMVYTVGDIYEGDFVNGIREGQGTYTFQTGVVYVGQFANNLFNGKGTMKFADGKSYEGDYVNGKIEGQGILTEKTGDYYSGTWKNEKRNGYGRQYNKSLNKWFEGTWKDNALVDSAAAVSTTNKCVSGDCKNGYGKIIYSTGNTYEGNFVNVLANGKGKATYANGSIYEGDFVNGKPEGKGIFTITNGEVYIGQFANGAYNGKGKLTYVNGNFYDGDWVKGNKEGQGTFAFKTGEIYVGQFANNKYNGRGKLKLPSGETYEGDWVNDKRHGKGENTFPTGDVYDGDYVDNKNEGQGTYTSKNGSYYTGEWKNNKQNGYGKEFNNVTKTTREGTWKDGILVGATNPKPTATPTTTAHTATSNASVAETAALLRDTLNGKFEYMEKKPLVYKLMKKSGETLFYRIEFIDDGGKLAFKWKEATKNEQSEKLIITDNALTSASKYVNFFSAKSVLSPDKEIVFILSQTLYKDLKTKNEVSLDLGKGLQRMSFNYDITASFGLYTEKKVKILYLQSDDRKSQIKILDDPVCPLIVEIDTPEYSLDLQKSN